MFAVFQTFSKACTPHHARKMWEFIISIAIIVFMTRSVAPVDALDPTPAPVCSPEDLGIHETVTCGENEEIVITLKGIYASTCNGLGFTSSELTCTGPSEPVFYIDFDVTANEIYTQPCKFSFTWTVVPIYNPSTNTVTCSRNTCSDPAKCQLINPTTVTFEIGDILHATQLQYQYPFPYDVLQFRRGAYFPNKGRPWPVSYKAPTYGFATGVDTVPSFTPDQKLGAQRPWTYMDPSHSRSDTGYCRKESSEGDTTYQCCFGTRRYQNLDDRSVNNMDEDDTEPLANNSEWESDMDVLRDICTTQGVNDWNYAYSTGYTAGDRPYYSVPNIADTANKRTIGYYPLQSPNDVLANALSNIIKTQFEHDTISFTDGTAFFSVDDDDNVPADSFNIENFNGELNPSGGAGQLGSRDSQFYWRSLTAYDKHALGDDSDLANGIWLTNDHQPIVEDVIDDDTSKISRPHMLTCGYCASADTKAQIPIPNQAAVDLYKAKQHPLCTVDRSMLFRIAESPGYISVPNENIDTMCADKTPARSRSDIIQSMERYRTRAESHWNVGTSPICALYKRYHNTTSSEGGSATWFNFQSSLLITAPGATPGQAAATPPFVFSVTNVTRGTTEGAKASNGGTVRIEVEFTQDAPEHTGADTEGIYIPYGDGVIVCDSALLSKLATPQDTPTQGKTLTDDLSILRSMERPTVNGFKPWENHPCRANKRCMPDDQFMLDIESTFDLGADINGARLLWYYVQEDVLLTEYIKDRAEFRNGRWHDSICTDDKVVKNGIGDQFMENDDCDVMEDTLESQSRCGASAELGVDQPCVGTIQKRGLQTDLCLDLLDGNSRRLCRPTRPPSYVGNSFDNFRSGSSTTNYRPYVPPNWDPAAPQYALGSMWSADKESDDTNLALYFNNRGRTRPTGTGAESADTNIHFSVKSYVTASTARPTTGIQICALDLSMDSIMMCQPTDATPLGPSIANGQVSLVAERGTSASVLSGETFIAYIQYPGATDCRIWKGTSEPTVSSDQTTISTLSATVATVLSFRCVVDSSSDGTIPEDKRNAGNQRIDIWQRGSLLVKSIPLIPCQTLFSDGTPCAPDNDDIICGTQSNIPGIKACALDAPIPPEDDTDESPNTMAEDDADIVPIVSSTPTPTSTPTTTPATSPTPTPTPTPIPFPNTPTPSPTPTGTPPTAPGELITEDVDGDEDGLDSSTITMIVGLSIAGVMILVAIVVVIVVCCIVNKSKKSKTE